MKPPPPRLTFKTEHVKVGYLVSLYVYWNGSEIMLSDDIQPETLNAMVLAHTPSDNDFLIGWKAGERRPGEYIGLRKYHDPGDSSVMQRSEHVGRLTDYFYGVWLPDRHRISKVESTIAGNHLQGMICSKCSVHNPYADPTPYVYDPNSYVCQGCKSWSGTIFHPVAQAAMSVNIPPVPETLPELPRK